MKPKFFRLVSLFGLAAAIVTGYVAFQRTRANEVVDEANVAIHTATLAAKLFQQQARAVGPLLSEATLRTDRAKLTAAARDASQFAAESEQAFRHAAETAQRAIDLTRNEQMRAVWIRKRDSLLQRAEGAAAGKEGYAVAADESIADLATMQVRMEPFAQRAETAKSEADRLNTEAEKLALGK